MKQLYGKVMIELNTDDIAEINELIIRDTALPVLKEEQELAGSYRYKCPVCRRTIVNNDTDNFCRQCGQRLDKENIAL